MALYRRPPVVEALIELQYSEALEAKQYDRLVKKLGQQYPEHELLHDFEVEIRTRESSAESQIKSRKDRHRYRTSDLLDVTTATPTHLTTARLAPYSGWERLLERLDYNIQLFHDCCGVRKFNKAGIRYINRLDVRDELALAAEDLFNINLKVGDENGLTPLNRFFRAEYRHASSGALLILHCGNIDPVLMSHKSYVVDIDLVLEEELPIKRSELVVRLTEMRQVKNQFFEDIVTDAARRLFHV